LGLQFDQIQGDWCLPIDVHAVSAGGTQQQAQKAQLSKGLRQKHGDSPNTRG